MLTSAKCYFCDNGANVLCVNAENAVFCNNCERKAGVNGEKQRFYRKGDSMRGYKAFNSDLTCRGFEYEIGGTYTLEKPDKLKICENGFHFCPTIGACYNYYPSKETTRICEVEALGEIQKSDEGDKMVTDKIKIVREITGPEKRGNLAEQDGYCNTGNGNTGNNNTGYSNAGYRNSGDFNLGGFNSGRHNSGDGNTGNFNSGDYNSGRHNTGDWNSGDHNSGWYNTGDYNSGNCNSGCFNTLEKPTISMFNKPSDWTMVDWMGSEAREIMVHLFLDEENKHDRWDKLDKKDKATVMSLPNFDAGIFEECTGIRVK